ncbi:hypothetical protein BpHYR1_040713, partial [Brachionus plicatilis]
MMLGRRPKIPIDLIIPPTDLLEREKILTEYKIVNEHGEVIVLEDYDDIVEKNLPAVATNYLQELKMKLKKSYQMAKKIEIVTQIPWTICSHWKKREQLRLFNKTCIKSSLEKEPVEQPDRQKRKYTKNLNNLRWKPIENHNEPEHNVTDTSITQPMSTGNVSSSD